ncbi:MAG: TonB-dependent receptor [Bacteroidetes bacterium]|nr:MAG: TonB-dependent receptor [Bacteroidota bacterium]
MRKPTVLLAGLLFCTLVFAQNKIGKISGLVTDDSQKPLQSVSVSLLRAKDSVLVKIAVTDKEGKYEFENISDGKFLLSVSSIGFTKTIGSSIEISSSHSSIKAETIKLVAEAKGMDAVTVVAKKPFIETKIDKTVVNVDASPTSAGASALEILEKSPGITVDNDGNINLRGKQGVIVMMDGKQTFLSPLDLANLLRNTPASALDQIEIMTNPSSKYDAAGNSGIINIKTKKGKNNGFNGSVMVGATASFHKPEKSLYVFPKSQNSFNFNWRKNKINLFGNYNPNYFRGQNYLTLDSKFLDENGNVTGYNFTETKFKFGNANHTVKLGLDWDITKKDIVGIVVSGFTFKGHPTPVSVADLVDENGVLESKMITNIDNDLKFKNATLNLNWKHTFDSTGRELTADFDYVTYRNVSDMLLTTDYYNNNIEKVGGSFLRGHLPAEIDIYTFKSDYTHPLKKGKIEAGIKTSFVKNDNLVNYERMVGGNWETDVIRSNHFIYDENINAAYVNYSRELKKWTIQAGLRLENTVANGNQVVTNQKFRRDTTNLFPTAFVSYKINAKNSMTVAYGRRIMRPNYQDLNPFTYFLDTLSYRQGNIYLRPQYTHNIDLTHSFNGKFITTLNFNTTDDIISQIVKQEPNSKIRFLTVDNVASFRNIGISITAPITVAKWWNANVFTNVYNNRYKGVYDTFDIDMSYTTFTINITNSYTFKKGWTGEISGFYRHKALNGLTKMEAVYQMSLGVQKQIMKGKGTLRLNVRDPFAWQVFEGRNEYGLISGGFRARPDVRQVSTSFTWRFGKNGQQNQTRRRNASSQDEQNRVGQGGQ